MELDAPPYFFASLFSACYYPQMSYADRVHESVMKLISSGDHKGARAFITTEKEKVEKQSQATIELLADLAKMLPPADARDIQQETDLTAPNENTVSSVPSYVRTAQQIEQMRQDGERRLQEGFEDDGSYAET